jgi:hypothetical protein
MPSTLLVGTMMIQDGSLLPTALGLKSDRFSEHWRQVEDIDSFSLDRKVRAAGWHLFCMAEQVKTIVFGRGGNTNVHRGVERLLAKVRSLNFNCFGLTEIVPRRFLGIPYVAISAQSYHIQEGLMIQSTNDRMRLQGAATWATGRPA